MLKQNWSVGQEIKKRANKEAEVEFWDKLTLPPLPKFIPTRVQPLSAGIWNLVRQMLP